MDYKILVIIAWIVQLAITIYVLKNKDISATNKLISLIALIISFTATFFLDQNIIWIIIPLIISRAILRLSIKYKELSLNNKANEKKR